MTATNLTAFISNIAYPVLNTSYSLKDNSDELSDVSLAIFDANGTYSFQFGQAVTITDTFEGVKFTGYVSKSRAVKYAANSAIEWTLDCVDNHFLAQTKTSNRTITNQYAGIAAVGMVNDYLASSGVIANYAVREDNTQAEFAQGTLSGTQATSNLGGDLELAAAGTTVTITQNTNATLGDGFLSSLSTSNNTLLPTSTKAIKMQCQQTGVGQNNSYTYVKIFQPAGTFTVVSTRYLYYEVWAEASSPEIKFGVDIVFTDNTTLRDNFTTGEISQNNLSPHPGTDLAGYADQNAWYGRTFDLTSFAGKNIAYVSIACEGDKPGTYTAYFRNIQYLNSDFSNNQYFFQNSLNVNPPQQLQNQGYASTSVTVVDTYDANNSYRLSNAYSISNVGLLKTSFISWNAVRLDPTDGTYKTSNDLVVKYSIDGGNSYIVCQNNAALPDLPAGSNLSGASIQFGMNFYPTNDHLETPLILRSLQLVLYPSYQAIKSDVTYSATVSTAWQNTGTFSNTQVSDIYLQLAGSTRYWNANETNNEMANMTLMGGGSTGPNNANSCFHYVNKKQLSLQVHQSTEARSRMDFAGQIADGTFEFDVYIDNSNMKNGCFYRTTGTSNYDAQYAYAIEVAGTTIALQKGSNSNTASNGTRTQVASATVNLTSQAQHRIKVIFSGSSHKIYLDDVLVINATDSTYTSAGYCGFRVSNADASNGYIAFFDNFGIMKALTGTWTSNNISLTSAANYGDSAIYWQDYSIDSQSTSLLVEATINGGTTWMTCTNGAAIPNFSSGQSLSGVNLKFRVTLTTATATSMPQIRYLIARVCGQYSSSGTRITPMLSLANAGTAGSTAVTWTATTPTNTSISVQTSLDGTTYTSATNGGSIAGITTQPDATLDTFSTHTGPNYTSTFFPGGSAIPWFWDTTNSRLIASGGSLGLLLYNAISASDIDIIIDMDQSDTGGIVWRYNNITNYYQLIVNDASSTNDPNTIMLVKRVSGIRNFLSAGTISFTRGTYRRVRVTMIGSVIAVYFDGVLTLTYTDATPLGSGQIGISNDSGTARFYNFRIQPQGDNLSGKVVYSKVTLTSTDPTQTPQLTDLTVAALNPLIGLGALIPTADYSNTYLSYNFDDLAKRSNYQWYIDPSLNFVFSAYVAQPAPWILQSSDQQLLLDGPVTVEYSGDLYRNRMTVKGVIATGTDSETKKGDGTTTSWSLGGNIVSPPTIYVNGQQKTIGIKGIDTGKDFYYTPDSNAIDQDSSGTVLQQTDTLLMQNYTYTYTTTITVDNTNLAGTITQKQFASIMGRTTAQSTVLNRPSTAYTSSGDFGDLGVGSCRRIAVDVNITAVSGTSPTIQFFIDRKDIFGNYYNIWSSSTASAATTISTTIGAFAAINQALGATVRLRWTITGTSPSFAFSASVIGIIDVQSGGLGIVEVVEDVTDQALNVAAAIAYCNGLLVRYGTIGRTLSFKTYRRNPSLAAGQSLPVFLPEHGINDAQMLITEIDTSQDIASDNGNPTQIYWQSVTCSENAIIGSPYKLLSSTLK